MSFWGKDLLWYRPRKEEVLVMFDREGRSVERRFLTSNDREAFRRGSLPLVVMLAAPDLVASADSSPFSLDSTAWTSDAEGSLDPALIERFLGQATADYYRRRRVEARTAGFRALYG